MGAVTTAVVQSSAVTTVMVVGFVNAGIMSLNQAAAVIMGREYRYDDYRADRGASSI